VLRSERRHALLDGRHAQDMRVAEARETGTLGVFRHVGLEADGAKLIGGAADGRIFSPRGSDGARP